MSEQTPTTCAVSTCDRPADGGTVCRPCIAVLEQVLAETDWLVDELTTTIAGEKSSRTDGDGGRSSERRLPFHIKAAGALRDLHGVLGSWTRMLSEERASEVEKARQAWEDWRTARDNAYRDDLAFDEPEPIRDHAWTLPADNPKAIASWLLHRLETIRHHVAGGDLVEEVSMRRASALWVIDRPAERVYAGPCECGADLYAKPGRPEATCQRCEGTYSVEAMQEWMRAQVSERLVTAREAAGLLSRFGYETQQKRIDEWAKRKRLDARGHDPKGVRLYLFGDLLRLAAQADTTRRARSA